MQFIGIPQREVVGYTCVCPAGAECPEYCDGGACAACARDQQAIHELETQAEAGWLRRAEALGFDAAEEDAYHERRRGVLS